MSLIRKAVRILHWLKHQERAVQRVTQINGSGLSTAQVGYDLSSTGACAIGTNSGSGYNQADVYQANDVAEGRNEFKGYDGALSGLNRQYIGAYTNFSGGLVENVGHGFPLGLKPRLGRSFLAFVNAWRRS